jgi:hypothetical protein
MEPSHVSVSWQFLKRVESATRDAQDIAPQRDLVCLTGVTISDPQGDIAQGLDDTTPFATFEAAVSDWDTLNGVL